MSQYEDEVAPIEISSLRLQYGEKNTLKKRLWSDCKGAKYQEPPVHTRLCANKGFLRYPLSPINHLARRQLGLGGGHNFWAQTCPKRAFLGSEGEHVSTNLCS